MTVSSGSAGAWRRLRQTPRRTGWRRWGCTSAAVSLHFLAARPLDGTAVAGQDHAATSGTLILPSGIPSGAVTIPVLDDVRDQPDERLTVILSNPENASLDDPVGAA